MQFSKINTDEALTYTVVFVLVVLGRCCCFPAVAGVEIAGELPGDTFGASLASGGPFPFFALKPNHIHYLLLSVILFRCEENKNNRLQKLVHNFSLVSLG